MEQVKNMINLKDTEVTAETIRIDDILKDYVQGMIDDLDDCGACSVDEIEHTSRDGYIPHSHNKGGYYSYIYQNIGSGGYNEFIQSQIDSNLEYVAERGVEKFGKDYNPCDNNDHCNWESETLSECQLDMFYVEARAMYHGQDGESHSATFELIGRCSDAPYFRYADWYAEFTVEFKDSQDLKAKLEEHMVHKKLLAQLSNGEEKNFSMDVE